MPRGRKGLPSPCPRRGRHRRRSASALRAPELDLTPVVGAAGVARGEESRRWDRRRAAARVLHRRHVRAVGIVARLATARVEDLLGDGRAGDVLDIRQREAE